MRCGRRMRMGAAAGLAAAALGATSPGADPGKTIFHGKGNCFTCHGPEGRGTPLAPSLRDTVWIHVTPDSAAIATLVRSGVPKPKQHPAPMPPMGGARLTDAEIAAVAKYVISLSKP